MCVLVTNNTITGLLQVIGLAQAIQALYENSSSAVLLNLFQEKIIQQTLHDHNS